MTENINPHGFLTLIDICEDLRAQMAKEFSLRELGLISLWAAQRTYEDHVAAEIEIQNAVTPAKCDLFSKWLSARMNMEKERIRFPGEASTEYNAFFDSVEASLGLKEMLDLRKELEAAQ